MKALSVALIFGTTKKASNILVNKHMSKIFIKHMIKFMTNQVSHSFIYKTNNQVYHMKYQIHEEKCVIDKASIYQAHPLVKTIEVNHPFTSNHVRVFQYLQR